MPYHVSKTSQCPVSKPWGVIKDSSGTPVRCHPTEEKAKKQLAALYANEPKAKTLTVAQARAEIKELFD